MPSSTGNATDPPPGPATRARAIVVQDGAVLLIERRWGDRHFFVFPGGGIEDGETAAKAARREVAEETGLLVAVGALVAVVGFPSEVQHFYRAVIAGGEIGTGHGEEVADAAGTGRGTYAPVWLPVARIAPETVYPEAVRRLVVAVATDGWPDRPLIARDPFRWWVGPGDPPGC